MSCSSFPTNGVQSFCNGASNFFCKTRRPHSNIVGVGDGLVSRCKDIDWEVLGKKLRISADRLCRGAAATFDCGLSGEDLVSEVLQKFFDSPNGLGWTKKKGTLENFLFKAVQHKRIDHLRRNKKVAGSLDDTSISLKGMRSRAETDPLAKIEQEKLVSKLYELVGDDQCLRDLIAAVELTDGGHNVNQQLGEIMDKTPQEVVNLKRRLMYVEGIRELLYEQRKRKMRPSG